MNQQLYHILLYPQLDGFKTNVKSHPRIRRLYLSSDRLTSMACDFSLMIV